MNVNEADFNALVSRMKRLERQNRFWQITGLAVFLILGVSLAANVKAQEKVQDIVEARLFLLRDSANHLMGQMAVRGDGKPVLELYDAAGKVTWSTSPRVGVLTPK
jgi:hypothetical protein